MSELPSGLTDQELEGLAAQAFNMARRDLEQRRGFNCLLASYHAGESLHRMERLERLLAEKLGERWVGDASVKEAAFDLIRMATGMLPPDAIVIACAVNRFVPTEKFHEEAFEKRQDLPRPAPASGAKGSRMGISACAPRSMRWRRRPRGFASTSKTTPRPGSPAGPKIFLGARRVPRQFENVRQGGRLWRRAKNRAKNRRRLV